MRGQRSVSRSDEGAPQLRPSTPLSRPSPDWHQIDRRRGHWLDSPLASRRPSIPRPTFHVCNYVTAAWKDPWMTRRVRGCFGIHRWLTSSVSFVRASRRSRLQVGKQAGSATRVGRVFAQGCTGREGADKKRRRMTKTVKRGGAAKSKSHCRCTGYRDAVCTTHHAGLYSKGAPTLVAVTVSWTRRCCTSWCTRVAVLLNA